MNINSVSHSGVNIRAYKALVLVKSSFFTYPSKLLYLGLLNKSSWEKTSVIMHFVLNCGSFEWLVLELTWTFNASFGQDILSLVWSFHTMVLLVGTLLLLVLSYLWSGLAIDLIQILVIVEYMQYFSLKILLLSFNLVWQNIKD